MGEKIDFPRNYEAFLKKAIAQFQEGNVETACDYFKSAYTIKQEPMVNTMYVSALYQLGDYQTAKKIADEKKEIYEKDENLYILYTTILIKSHLFVEAERIIQKKLAQASELEGRPLWETAQLELNNERFKQKKEKEKRDQEIVKNVLSMGSQSFEYQSALVKQMTELDVDSYLFSAKSLLSNPFVNEIVKSTVLEGLIKQNCAEEFELYWFKQKRTIVPSQTTSLEKNETVHSLLTLLSDKLEDSNPSLYQMLLQEINLHCLLLHPYIDEVITDPQQWLTLCFMRYDSNSMNECEDHLESEKMTQWVDFLNTEIENMVQ